MLTSCYVKIYIFGQSVVLLLHTPVTWQQSQLQAIQNLLLPTFAPLTSCCVFLLNSFSIDFVWVYIFFNADQAEYVQYNCFVPNIPGPASLQPLHGVEPNTMFDIVLQQRKQWAYNHPFKPLLNPPPPRPPSCLPCFYSMSLCLISCRAYKSLAVTWGHPCSPVLTDNTRPEYKTTTSSSCVYI